MPNDKSKTEIYADMLKLQAEIQFPFERHFYSHTDLWKNATNVLDVGCGDLSYTTLLDGEFPGKSFTCIEVDPQMNAVAVSVKRPNMTILSSLDSLPTSQKFDVILLRLVLLHVSDREQFLKKVTSHLTSNGAIVLFEADDEMLYFEPEPAEFVAALNELRSKSKDRNLLPVIENEMRFLGLKLSYLDRIVVNNRFPHASEKLFQYMYRTAELGIGRPIPDSLSRELVNWWLRKPYVQYGFFGAVFVR